MEKRGAMARLVWILLALILSFRAQAAPPYPSRPVRIVVGFISGDATDHVARALAPGLGEVLGEDVVVENRGGAGGAIATEAVARAEPDGYTLLLVPFTNAVNETLMRSLRFRMGEQLVGVAPVAQAGLVLAVHPSLPATSVAGLVALAKSRPPGELIAATPGRGTPGHMANELFNSSAGVKIASLHYKSEAETVNDLVSGEVKVLFAHVPPILRFLRSGAARVIATTAAVRDPLLPDVPTIAESGIPGFEVRMWTGLAAPAGTSPAIVEQLSAATGRALDRRDVRAALARLGYAPFEGTSREFAAFYAGEVDKWRKVLAAAGLAAR